MIKQIITYNNLDGESVTETFYFHLSMAEIAKEQLFFGGDYSDYLKKIVAAQDGKKMIETFETLVRKSVGQRSEDGKRFIKSEQISDEFMQTGAYDKLFMQLITDTEFSLQFCKGIFPTEVAEKAMAIGAASEENPQEKRNPESYTQEEIVNMSKDEFYKTFGNDTQRWPRNVLVAAMARKTV